MDARSVLSGLGLPNVALVADPGDVASREARPGWTVRFPDALKRAVTAFLENDRGSGDGLDAPIGLIRDQPENHGLSGDVTVAQATAKLREYLASDPKAAVVLLGPATLARPDLRFPPEYGESPDDQWVFRVLLPTTLDVLTWAIVDPKGQAATYCYSIE